MEHATGISTYLFGEAKDHLLELELFWEEHVEERLAALGTPERSDEPRKSESELPKERRMARER
ncbi:MAG: hypothetical protein ABI785_10865 [Gemmatimonadales bacterium]